MTYTEFKRMHIDLGALGARGRPQCGALYLHAEGG